VRIAEEGKRKREKILGSWGYYYSGKMKQTITNLDLLFPVVSSLFPHPFSLTHVQGRITARSVLLR